jgi:signal transduction histidine kinase
MEQASRDEALSIVAHELRNELNVLATWAALLKRPDLGAARVNQAATVMDRITETAMRLCDDLRALAAESAPVFQPRRIDLREVAVAGVTALAAGAGRKHVRLVHRVGSAPVWVIGDRVRLGEVVSNLLGNALTFTGPGDTITVEVLEEKGVARLVVADTGEGISASFLPHAFEKFTQEPHPPAGGRGLGLYVVRTLVELHKGHVEVESGGPALGTRFVVTLDSAAAA